VTGWKGRLSALLTSGKFLHACILSGGTPSLRREAALYIAAFLNCPDQGEKPCGLCPACAQVAQGNHPNVHLLAPERDSLKIEQIRGMRERLQQRPFQPGAQVAILEDGHKLTEAAASALLKILEEPPPDTYILILAPQALNILPTLRSRCGEIYLGIVHEVRERAQAYWEGILEGDLLTLFDRLLPQMEKEEAIYDLLLSWEEFCCEGLKQGLAHGEKEKGQYFLEIFRALERTRKALRYNANLRLALEALLWGMYILREEKGVKVNS